MALFSEVQGVAGKDRGGKNDSSVFNLIAPLLAALRGSEKSEVTAWRGSLSHTRALASCPAVI